MPSSSISRFRKLGEHPRELTLIQIREVITVFHRKRTRLSLNHNWRPYLPHSVEAAFPLSIWPNDSIGCAISSAVEFVSLIGPSHTLVKQCPKKTTTTDFALSDQLPIIP